MSYTPTGRPDPQDGFSYEEEKRLFDEEQQRIADAESEEWDDEFDEENDDWYEDDGQPDEYTEWQDLYGGDDWDHGQYDDCF